MDLDALLGWRGRTVLARDGEKLGKLGDLYLDDATDRPAWGAVEHGLLGRHHHLLPLDGLTEDEHGDLIAPYDAELVRGAPDLDPDASLAPGEEEALSAHYGRQVRQDLGVDDEPGTMIRSEEEVQTGVTAPKPAERVRLKKVLVTEHVEQTVPVRREEIRLETEPAPEGHIERVEDLGDAPAS